MVARCPPCPSRTAPTSLETGVETPMSSSTTGRTPSASNTRRSASYAVLVPERASEAAQHVRLRAGESADRRHADPPTATTMSLHKPGQLPFGQRRRRTQHQLVDDSGGVLLSGRLTRHRQHSHRKQVAPIATQMRRQCRQRAGFIRQTGPHSPRPARFWQHIPPHAPSVRPPHCRNISTGCPTSNSWAASTRSVDAVGAWRSLGRRPRGVNQGRGVPQSVAVCAGHLTSG